MDQPLKASHETLRETVKLLGRRFVLAALLMLLGCGGLTVVVLEHLDDLREDGEAINIAGRQRAMAISLALYAAEARNAQSELERSAAMRKFQRSVENLEVGFEYLGTPEEGEVGVPSQIASYYENLYANGTGLIWLYVRDLEAYAMGGDAPSVTPEQALKTLDDGVAFYQNDYLDEWELLRLVLFITVAALIVLVLIIYGLILLPLKLAVVKQAGRMALFGKAVEQSGSMVIVTNKDGTIQYANRRAIEDLGYPAEELIGQHTRLFNSGQTSRNVYKSMWETINKGQVWKGEFINQRKTGETFWVQATISPIRDAKGVIEGFMSIEQDITLFKNALLENEEVREQLLTAIEAVDDAFALFDKNERMVLWNSRCQMMFDGVQDLIRPGVTFEELLRQGAQRGQYGDVGDVDLFVERRLEEFRRAEGEVEIRLANGTWLMGTDRKTADGGRVMLRVDITKMKEVEEALRVAKKQADAANQAKSSFLSSMSHELRTPLNAILGFAQMMQMMPQEPLGKQQTRCVDHILKGGKHLLDLINEVLDLAKIEAGKVDVSIEPLKLDGVIAECISLVEKSASDRGITVVAPSEDSADVMIRADLTRCKQVILNLLSNAVKYNREGGTVQIQVGVPSGSHVRIRITDTGYGIPAERYHEVFKPFNRLGAENSDIEGTGIGLSITKQLTRLMGGDIGFSSQVNVGSEFWVDLVLHQSEAISAKVDRPIPQSSMMADPKLVSGVVLCVEDNPANMSLLDMVFTSLPNVTMVPAVSAEEGLAHLKAHKPNLILMDINLPGMDGFEALERIRSNPDLAHLPVVAMTANAANNMIARGLDAGFDRVLIKPMVVPELLSVVGSYLKEKGNETGPRSSAA